MENKKSTTNIFHVILFVLFISAVLPGTSMSTEGGSGKEERQPKSHYANTEIAIMIIPSANNTFGYDILLYGRPLIHQPNVPGLPGNEGFTTKEKAQTVATFVVKKIRNNEMPPTVTIDDLHMLDVLK